jgi:hypothetical protein
VIAQAAKAIRQILAIRGRHAALTRRDDLARVKREAPDIAERPDRAAVISRADRASGILDGGKPVLPVSSS